MNKVILMGRLTKDPDVRYTNGQNPVCIARYDLAVNRKYKRDGEPDADFFSCVCFGKMGEFVEKYLKKGTKIAISGRLQTGNYTNRNGQKVYYTEVVVEDQEFAESKQNSAPAENSAAAPANDEGMDGFMNIPDGIDQDMDMDKLPFA